MVQTAVLAVELVVVQAAVLVVVQAVELAVEPVAALAEAQAAPAVQAVQAQLLWLQVRSQVRSAAPLAAWAPRSAGLVAP